jgi:hypothetical protein
MVADGIVVETDEVGDTPEPDGDDAITRAPGNTIVFDQEGFSP